MQEVRGSSPLRSTKRHSGVRPGKAAVATSGRVPRCLQQGVDGRPRGSGVDASRSPQTRGEAPTKRCRGAAGHGVGSVALSPPYRVRRPSTTPATHSNIGLNPRPATRQPRLTRAPPATWRGSAAGTDTLPTHKYRTSTRHAPDPRGPVPLSVGKVRQEALTGALRSAGTACTPRPQQHPADCHPPLHSCTPVDTRPPSQRVCGRQRMQPEPPAT